MYLYRTKQTSISLLFWNNVHIICELQNKSSSIIQHMWVTKAQQERQHSGMWVQVVGQDAKGGKGQTKSIH